MKQFFRVCFIVVAIVFEMTCLIDIVYAQNNNTDVAKLSHIVLYYPNSAIENRINVTDLSNYIKDMIKCYNDYLLSKSTTNEVSAIIVFAINQPTPPQSGRGMVVLVRYLTQGTYPLVRGKPRGMYPSHTIIIERRRTIMAYNRDWYPRKRDDQLAMIKNWLVVLGTKASVWGVPETEVTALQGLAGNAQILLNKAKSSDRTKVITRQCTAAFSAMEDKARFIKNHWFLKPPLTDADLMSLGLDPPDTTLTSAGQPKAVAEADISWPSVHVLELFIRPVKGSPVDPPGTDSGFRVYYGIMPPGGASPEEAMSYRRELHTVPAGGRDLPHSTFTRRHRMRFDFDEADSGKRVYFCIKIENAKGGLEGEGPWGPLFSAIIP
jgi:hypothetical protein